MGTHRLGTFLYTTDSEFALKSSIMFQKISKVIWCLTCQEKLICWVVSLECKITQKWRGMHFRSCCGSYIQRPATQNYLGSLGGLVTKFWKWKLICFNLLPKIVENKNKKIEQDRILLHMWKWTWKNTSLRMWIESAKEKFGTLYPAP